MLKIMLLKSVLLASSYSDTLGMCQLFNLKIRGCGNYLAITIEFQNTYGRNENSQPDRRKVTR